MIISVPREIHPLVSLPKIHPIRRGHMQAERRDKNRMIASTQVRSSTLRKGASRHSMQNNEEVRDNDSSGKHQTQRSQDFSPAGEVAMMRRISQLAPVLAVLGIVLLLLRKSLFSASYAVIAGQLLALGLNGWGRVSFSAGQFRIGAEPADGGLLRGGPYKFIRHPMYASLMLFVWSGILGHWSLTNVIIGLGLTLVMAVRIAAEEQLLRTSYPEYSQYARDTKRIIPYLL